MKHVLIALFLVCGVALTAADSPKLPDGYRLLYEQDFSQPGAIKDFVFSDAKAWRYVKDADKGALELHQQSKYEPKNRSPFNIALLADKVFGDFVLEVELLSTKKPYPHQDMCVFFGFTDVQKFYYNHLAVGADPHAHNLFIVNEAPRLAFAKETTKGIAWGLNEWHKVRIERDTKAGTVKVFFDDLTKPIMQAEDKTFPRGNIGFGSFDDVGKVGRIKIWGPSMETKRTEFFQRAP